MAFLASTKYGNFSRGSNGFSFETDFSHNKTFKTRRKSLQLRHANEANILTPYRLRPRTRPPPASSHNVLTFWVVTYLLHVTCYLFQTGKKPYQWFPYVLDCRYSPQNGETLLKILWGISPPANRPSKHGILAGFLHVSNGYLLIWYQNERSTPQKTKWFFFFCQ